MVYTIMLAVDTILKMPFITGFYVRSVLLHQHIVILVSFFLGKGKYG